MFFRELQQALIYLTTSNGLKSDGHELTFMLVEHNIFMNVAALVFSIDSGRIMLKKSIRTMESLLAHDIKHQENMAKLLGNSQRDFTVLKEPRGFLRIMQLALAVLAFSLTVGYGASAKFTVKCQKKNVTHSYTVNFQYPFNIHEDSVIPLPLCDLKNQKVESTFYGNYAPHSQFFVFVGVTNMIFCLAIIVVYICCADWYSQQDPAPKTDFVVTAVWAVVWFIASVAWAAGQAHLTEYATPSRLFVQLKECWKDPHHHTGDLCSVISAPGFGTLAVSVIIGFLSSVLSVVTMHFLWKETSWARSRQYTSDLNDHTADGSPF